MPLGRTFVPPGADQPLYIRLHQQLHHSLRHAPKEIIIAGFRQQVGQR
jgi:hypothetical protein